MMVAVVAFSASAQEWERKFEQLGTELPTPNSYRTASGAPGTDYWQQRADYKIAVEIDDANQVLSGDETVTYHNYSPDPLKYLWVQLDQNMRGPDSNTPKTQEGSFRKREDAENYEVPAKFFLGYSKDYNYEGGYKIAEVKDANGKDLSYTINQTMMRIDMPKVLASGESFIFSVKWSYNINDRMLVGGRGGYEYFPEDDNYLYTIAQWFPRMASYNDVNGWQNKQFLGSGEFTLIFGDYDVKITVPEDHIIGSTGALQNPEEVLTETEMKRFEKAKTTTDEPVIIVTQKEATKKEKTKATGTSTWHYKAENVRDFAFATSRKFIWDAMAVNINGKMPLAMSYYPKEGNPLWEKESTVAVANTLIGYSKRTIDYPYPVAISVHAASIGMEYPMICFNFGRPDDKGNYTPQTKWRMIGVIVHEVGHNFFPMIVNSDERQWTWMDEGINTFVQAETQREFYKDMPARRGTAKSIVNYMKGDKSYIRPIMTNSEQLMQFGNNAYAKPAAALSILRETIMGPELFDYAFKEYATRWAFKSPEPADLFRTLEDASAVDLDWFWKGWFFTTDNVDISVDNVRWFRVNETEQTIENKTQAGKIKNAGAFDADGNNMDFSNGFEMVNITDTDPRYYGEYQNRVDDESIRKAAAQKNYYEITLTNQGGLVMPLIIEWTFKDGSTEIERIPAEIWRKNEKTIKKVFAKEKEVVNITLDPNLETADTNVTDNYFPKREVKSKLEEFKDKKN